MFHLHVREQITGTGQATVEDADVLVVLVSHVTRQHNNESLPAPATVTLTTAELLRDLGRPNGGRQRQLLTAAIKRLANTQISTSLGANPFEIEHVFVLLESVTPPSRAGQPWTFMLPSWLLHQIQDGRVLKIDPAHLHLHGLERRIASWARAYAGGAGFPNWRIDLRRAYVLSAAQGPLRQFRAAIRSIIRANAAGSYLPDFLIALERQDANEVLVITRRLFPGGSPRPDPLAIEEINILDHITSDTERTVFAQRGSEP